MPRPIFSSLLRRPAAVGLGGDSRERVLNANSRLLQDAGIVAWHAVAGATLVSIAHGGNLDQNSAMRLRSTAHVRAELKNRPELVNVTLFSDWFLADAVGLIDQ